MASVESKDNASVIKGINRLCYCQSLLKECENISDKTICKNCCKYNQHLYGCFHDQCIYTTISTQSYIICYPCYNDHNSNNNTDKFSFIFNKFIDSLITIS